MQVEIPDIGDVDAVEVIEILVAVGDVVAVDDPLIVIESDKASMEVPAPAAGTVESIAVTLGDSVTMGDPILSLAAADVPPATATPSATATAASEPPAIEPEPAAAASAAPTPVPAAAQTAVSVPGTSLQVVVPDVGDADAVSVVEIAVSQGDAIAAGDLLLVLESDKASMELPTDHAGTVSAVHVKIGDEVQAGDLLVTLDDVAQAVQPSPAQPQAAAASSPQPLAPARPPAQAAEATATPEAQTSVYAGPAVRRLARELGVDLTAVQASGARGRIVKEDVDAHVRERMQKADSGGGIPALPTIDFARFGPVDIEPLGRTRVVGAQNLHRSWLNVVHVTQHDEADVTDLEDFRKSLARDAEARGIKLTPLAFIVKACVAALKEFPQFNSSLDATGENYILKRYYHIGIAVDTPAGLLVPVIRDADTKGVWELSAEIAELATKARERKLGMDQLSGGSFSVSSLGRLGGTGFTPIVNAPEVAILGVGRMAVRPKYDGQAFVPAKMLPLSVSYDHRAINGAEAGRFTVRLAELLTDVRHLVM